MALPAVALPHQAKTGVADRGHARVGYQNDLLARCDAVRQFGGHGFFIFLPVGEEAPGFGDIQFGEKFSGHPGILAGDAVGGAEVLGRTLR